MRVRLVTPTPIIQPHLPSKRVSSGRANWPLPRNEVKLSNMKPKKFQNFKLSHTSLPRDGRSSISLHHLNFPLASEQDMSVHELIHPTSESRPPTLASKRGMGTCRNRMRKLQFLRKQCKNEGSFAAVKTDTLNTEIKTISHAHKTTFHSSAVPDAQVQLSHCSTR